jgi:GntR family transcriptional regulator
LLEAGLREPTPDEAEALDLGPGDRLVSISRVRLADDIPIAIEHATLPVECAAVLAADLEKGSLHEALIDLARYPSTAQSAITARAASADEARLLDVAQRSPVLVERRRIHDAHGSPLEYTETIYAPERYVIDASFAWAPKDGRSD